MTSTPVAYIVFNRPRLTRETFEAIRSQKPSKLFVIADGPRPDHPADTENCREVREIVSRIDWPCEVQRNYADQNLGCRQRMISGLDWVFSQVERAIILEDDCLPHPDFYSFCDDLLERYTDDERIMVVTGNNFQQGHTRGRAAYYFSKNNHVWGWATWRRAWQKNDPTIAFWPEWKKSDEWISHTPDKLERRYYTDILDKMYRNEVDTWDYQWCASIWYHGGLTATPNVNLVTNIGFGPDATHTIASEDQRRLPAGSLGPLTHPERVRQNRRADRYVFDHSLGGLEQRLYMRILMFLRRVAGKIYRAIKGWL